MGRLGGAECSMTFSSGMSLNACSGPPWLSLAFVDTELSPSEEARGLRVGEAADEGASAVLLLCLEGDAWN